MNYFKHSKTKTKNVRKGLSVVVIVVFPDHTHLLFFAAILRDFLTLSIISVLKYSCSNFAPCCATVGRSCMYTISCHFLPIQMAFVWWANSFPLLYVCLVISNH